MAGIVKRGLLTKEGHLVKNWKQRLFELDADGGALHYYTLQGKVHKGSIGLSPNTWVQHLDSAMTSRKFTFEIVTGSKRLVLSAETERMAQEWADAVQHVIKPDTGKVIRCNRAYTPKQL